MNPCKKQHFARRGILFFVGTLMAVSAQGAEPPGGIRYSDFIKHGADAYAPLAFERGLTPAYPAFADVSLPALGGAGGLFGLGSGLSGVIAVGVVVGSLAGLSSVAGGKKDSPTNTATAPPSLTLEEIEMQAQAACSGDATLSRPTFIIPEDPNISTETITGQPSPTSGRPVSFREHGIAGHRLADSRDRSDERAGYFLRGITTTSTLEVRGRRFSDIVNGSDKNLRYNLPNSTQTVFVAAGDVIGLVVSTPAYARTARPFFDLTSRPLTPNSPRYRVYSGITNSIGVSLFVAAETATPACTLAAEQFFLNENWQTTQRLSESRSDFSLRFGWRGMLNEKYALRLNNLLFSQSGNFNNIHVESSHTPFVRGNFTLDTNSGWRLWGDGKHAVIYTQPTARWDVSHLFGEARTSGEVYARMNIGKLSSTTFADGTLRGLAFGVFADKVLRHDDSYHLRLESPFADTRAPAWRLAADASIGTPGRYLRLGLHHQLDGNKAGAHLFYSREF